MQRPLKSLMALSALVGALALSSSAQAHLGSFGPNDGYFAQYGTSLGDVTYYNAGQNGINSGGGPMQQIVADSGLWKLKSPVGGVFTTNATRNAYIFGAPPYAPSDPNNQPAYLLGGHFPGRNFDGYNLAFRNDTPVGTGPAIYDYSLDTYDTGGPAPASITSGPLNVGFYFCPNPADPINAGAKPLDKFTLSLRDSSGNVGLQWGYARDNEVLWRDSPSNAWNYTGVYANAANWDGVEIKLDLTNDTFGINYYEVSTNTWSVMAPVGTPMGAALTNLTTLRWQLEDGVASGTGGKNYFDDFSFQAVPEPSSIALAAIGGLALIPVLRRRRQANVA